MEAQSQKVQEKKQNVRSGRTSRSRRRSKSRMPESESTQAIASSQTGTTTIKRAYYQENIARIQEQLSKQCNLQSMLKVKDGGEISRNEAENSTKNILRQLCTEGTSFGYLSPESRATLATALEELNKRTEN